MLCFTSEIISDELLKSFNVCFNSVCFESLDSVDNLFSYSFAEQKLVLETVEHHSEHNIMDAN